MMIHVGLGLMLAISTLAYNDGPSVNTPLGSIEGFWETSRGGRRFQSYVGIPYALPPVGELRFEPPQPVAAWEGSLPAKFPSFSCLQYAAGSATSEPAVTGAEDCLYLNVYVPGDRESKENRTKSLPVIVNIHGGSFQALSAIFDLPHYLMDRDVILVTINYRLGPLGFLSTEDGVVPGNMGLKDQNLAIKWVSVNIGAFGGDPKRVTLTGISAGGTSVHLHYLSPMSRGLFHRGISHSGTALNCWAQTENSLEKAKKLGALMGCPTNGSEQLIRCLKTRPGKTILEYERNFMAWLYNPDVPFGPVVERNSTMPFIDKSPVELIDSGESGDLPWIASTVTEEGLFPAAEFILNETLMKELDEKWNSIAPHLLDYNYTVPSSKHVELAQIIKRHYMGDKRVELSSANDLIRMLSDRLIIVDAGKAAKQQARAISSPVWFYYFNYRGEHSISDFFTGSKQNFGVSHGDDNLYVLADQTVHFSNEQDLRMSHDMVNLWVSFATTGTPNMSVEWPPVDGQNEELKYLRILGPGQLRVESDANFGNKNFWSSIDFNENKPKSE